MVGGKRWNFSSGYIKKLKKKVSFLCEKKCMFFHFKCSLINSLNQTKGGGHQQSLQDLFFLCIPGKEDRQCRQTIMLGELPNMSI